MQDRATYEYAVIRLVPFVEREEFINVGVIVFSKSKKYLNLRFHVDHDKVRAFSPDTNIEEVREYINAWKLISDGNEEGGKLASYDQAYRYRWLVAPKSTIIQCSPTHPGLCEDPSKILEKHFRFYVL